MAENGFRVEVADRLATVTLSRPDALNTLTFATMDALTELFAGFNHDDDVWAVLLTARGERAFCAGIDIKAAGAQQPSGMAAMPMGGPRRNLFETMLECTKPVVAAVNGAAAGAGCELALASDIRIMAEHARIGLPEAKVGMGANFANQILPRLIARGHAYEMLYTGELISARQAFDWGLVNRVVPAAQLHGEARDLCRKIIGNAPLTVRRYKELLTKGADLPMAAALRLNAGPHPYTSEDRLEGFAAFREKRTPQWRAR
ncbi:enoyl-CoA hydratase/isomerase family protein [Tomitella gaofuii]|uniref:enoyl-CoA hydratase/isomerase family protein n=1 Tax=Tomitella gaofuii TaxID=2760083 RepID=UPI001C71455E|nr:enoyl-CoA hydratase-related protein [Tomitella gaofuii]